MENALWQTPSLEAATQAAIQDRILRLHTALPGQIVQFDAEQQTAQVQPMIEQLFKDGSRQPLPILADVPVQFPRGGGFVLTFPIKPGDECLLVFNERCIDGWWQSGHSSEPMDYRQHDLSDAVAIMGISSSPFVVGGFATDGVELRSLSGAATVKIDEGGTITINGTSLVINCPVSFAAGMTGTGDVVSSGISLEQHLHAGIFPGPGVTGGPL